MDIMTHNPLSCRGRAVRCGRPALMSVDGIRRLPVVEYAMSWSACCQSMTCCMSWRTSSPPSQALSVRTGSRAGDAALVHSRAPSAHPLDNDTQPVCRGPPPRRQDAHRHDAVLPDDHQLRAILSNLPRTVGTGTPRTMWTTRCLGCAARSNASQSCNAILRCSRQTLRFRYA